MSSIAPTTTTCAKSVPEAKTISGAIGLFYKFPTPKILSLKILVFALLRTQLGAITAWDLVIAIGVVLWWPFQEWFLHKTVLHLKPRMIFGRHFDPMFSKRHRYHHRFPWILETTFLPTKFVLTLVPLHIAAWCFAMPDLSLACTGIAFYTLVTLVYEWTHFLTHSPYRPRSQYVKTIYKNHALHHFKNEHYWFSFTVPWIDTAMGTSPEAGVEQSETCRTLGVEDAFAEPA
jgi:hypothetical protein